MNRKLLIAALSGALLIAQNALAIDAPKGWKATTASDGTVYTPTDAKENSVSLVISPPLPDEGKTAAQLLEKASQGITEGEGVKIVKRGKVTQKGKRAETVIEVEIAGSPVRVTYAAYPLGKGNMRAVIIFMDGDAQTLKRYEKAANDIIDAQYAEDTAGKK